MVKFTDYTAEKVRTLLSHAASLRERWADPASVRIDRCSAWRSGASTSTIWPRPPTSPTPTRSTCSATGLQCAAAHPPGTGRAAAPERKDFFDAVWPRGQGQILDELLDKYAEHGAAQFVIPEVLEVPPISDHGNVIEIAVRRRGALRQAVVELQTL